MTSIEVYRYRYRASCTIIEVHSLLTTLCLGTCTSGSDVRSRVGRASDGDGGEEGEGANGVKEERDDNDDYERG